MVRGLAPSARLVYALGGTQKFELPVEEAAVDAIFARMEAVKSRRVLGGAGVGAGRKRAVRQCGCLPCLLLPTTTHLPTHAHTHAVPRPRPPAPVLSVCSGEVDLVDWGVSHATLEEVFIRITREAGVHATAFA